MAEAVGCRLGWVIACGRKMGCRMGLVRGFGPRRWTRGLRSIFAIVNPKNVDKLKAAIREEFDRVLKEGVTEQELESAKKGYLQRQEVGRNEDATSGGKTSGNVAGWPHDEVRRRSGTADQKPDSREQVPSKP